jgi:arsenate reductase
MKVYGIPNCDTVKKALTWLSAHKIEYQFYNYKTEGITKSKLSEWISKTSWKEILNQKSATFRKLLSIGTEAPTSKTQAINLMLENTSIIKRPIIEKEGMLIVGFDPLEMNSLLKTK